MKSRYFTLYLSQDRFNAILKILKKDGKKVTGKEIRTFLYAGIDKLTESMDDKV